MIENQFTYWAFLSHSQQDNCEQRQDAPAECHLCWGDWLYGELKTFSIPAVFAGQINARGEVISERIDPVFQDREEQPENASLSEKVSQALDQSKCLIVICSPRSAKSLQVNEQVRYFKQLGRSNRVLPIVIAGEPNASDGHQPGRSPEDECFVPALRHPLMPDGTLDTSRRDRNSIFADARQGDARREMLAKDLQNGAIELETAKIQLIAGLIGVGFHGLWSHELKRRFAEARHLAREARAQNQQDGIPHQEAAQSQLLEAQRQAREALGQVVEARNETRAAEAKVLEAQQLARQAQNQLAEARQQVIEAQNPVLEAQNLPPDVNRQTENSQNQLQMAQDQARNAQSQAAEARQQAQELENKVLESQNQVAQAQSRVREMEDQARQAQNQLAVAQTQAGAAESKLLETQQQVRETQNQLAETNLQARELDHKFLESQTQVRQAQSQVLEAENQARQTQLQLAEAQNQARAADSKVLAAQHQIQQIESQHHAALNRMQEVQNQALEAQARVRTAQDQVLESQDKTLVARRRTKVFALIAVLALMAAGASVWQRRQSAQALARKNPPEVTEPGLATGPLNWEQIQQALQKASDAGQDVNRLRSLDELAVRIPAEEFSNTLGASSALLADPPRRHFQELVLDAWMKTNLPAAFDWSCQLTDTNSRQRTLEQLIPALAADNPTNTLARLNELNPAPDDRTYLLFFQRWAATDPVQAIDQRRQIPGHDAGDNILSAIMTVWVDQQPAAALNWLESQPDSASLPAGTWRNKMIVTLLDAWAAKDLEAAATACQQLPDGMAKEKAWECVLSRQIVNAPAAAAEPVKHLAPGDYRQKAIAELCRHWADTDAPAALAWVPSLPDGDERVTATNQVIAGWAANDPQAAAQFASQHPELSGANLGDIASAWSRRDLSAATNWISRLPDGEKKDTALLALANATTDRAPLLAAELSTRLTTNRPATELLQGIATSLARVDLASAVEWARGLKEEPARQAALSALSEPWAQNDPQGMTTYALGLPPGDAQVQLLKTAGRQLSRRDLPGMVKLLTPLSDGGLRQSILEEAGRDCDLLHLEQTAKFISTMPAGDDQQAVLRGLLANWTAADPEAAVNWLVAFPETNAQPEQVQSVLKAWSQSEPAAVAKWLGNLPSGIASDEMIGAFLEGAEVKYPAYAAQWTQSVTDDAQRQKFQLQVARQWLKTDPSAALKWTDSLRLPEAIRQSLQAQLP
jgi:hypothetical protein